ncbi:MAG: hypothetical protein QGG58_12465, partial [Chloroflexota bacterium]|nr:hypothetical protein [Chloroflexota bacterium]
AADLVMQFDTSPNLLIGTDWLLTSDDPVNGTTIIPEPDIDIEKATNGEDADDPTGPLVPVGDAVTWTYVVTNTGNVELTNSGGLTIDAVDTILTSSSAGDTILIASSPITFAVDSTQKNLTATATESAAANVDNITVNAGVAAAATAGDVNFRAGDRIIVAATGSVTASGHIVFDAAFGDTDSDGAMTLDGLLQGTTAGV